MDKIDICNMALSRLGVETIESLNEASEPARVCRQFYDHTRRNILRRFNWTFAIRRVHLAELSTKPENYLHSYRYPSDCLFLKSINTSDYDNIPAYTGWMLASDESGRLIYTNVEKASAEYVADIEDCSLFDEQFADILAWKLAADMAFKLTGNMQVAQMADQQYNALYLEAAANSEDEQNIKAADPYTFAGARFSGLGGD